MTTTVTKFKLANVSSGYAEVCVIADHGGERYVGDVMRGEYGWVPLTRDKVSWANPPTHPAFQSRQAAAQALANGEVVY